MSSGSRRWEFWIDVGGTFTDCLARRPDGAILSHKLLSTGTYKGAVEPGSSATAIVDSRRCHDPNRFFDGFRLTLFVPESGDQSRQVIHDGIAIRAFDAAAGSLKLDRPLDSAPAIGMTYELTSPEEAPLTGIRWLLGKRLSEDLGDIDVRLSTTRGTNALLENKGAAVMLVTTTGFGDMLAIGYQSRPRLFDLHVRKPAPLYQDVIELSERIDTKGTVLRPLDPAEVRRKLAAARA
ncbi:MAG: hydantoinase, partial [Planctomycetota bacterium]|nr:hydantoinase [Planctomycetota bacterium]